MKKTFTYNQNFVNVRQEEFVEKIQKLRLSGDMKTHKQVRIVHVSAAKGKKLAGILCDSFMYWKKF